MSIKKTYTKPEIQSEVIQVGVFGSYGSSGGNIPGISTGGSLGIVLAFANPLFKICCS